MATPKDRPLVLPHVLAFLVGIFFFIVLTSWLINPVASHTHATIIGLPAIPPVDEPFVTFSILQMNDVYEVLPVGNGTRGGLARVATIRKWLLKQTPDVITVLAGDMLSPCALEAAGRLTGDLLHGKHMVSVMNSLGLDYMMFGNHEFDLPKSALQERIAESEFEWVSSNVLEASTGEPFQNVSQFKLLNIHGCRVLIIAVTVDENSGENNYATVIPTKALPEFIHSFIAPFRGHYDVLVAMTHLPIDDDVVIAETVPEIDLIIGGHDHEGWHIWRGPQSTHITKADANAATVFIHRITFGMRTRKVTIQRRLVPVNQEIPEDPEVAALAEDWYKKSFQKFEALGLHPTNVVVSLPVGVELDGRDKSLRHAPTLLSTMVCDAQVKQATAFQPSLGFINGGLIRIDDRIQGTITEYDVIRMFPFPNVITAAKVKGGLLAEAFTWGRKNQDKGWFSFPCGAKLNSEGHWVTDSGSVLDESDELFVIATNSYLLEAKSSPLSSSEVIRLGDVGPYTTNVVEYLKKKFQSN